MFDLPECENGERPIRLVTGHVFHRRSPEVVFQQVSDGILAGDILVEHHGRYVIVDEVPGEAIQIAGYRHGAYQSVRRPYAGPTLF